VLAKALKKNRTLKVLGLWGNQIKGQGILSLANAISDNAVMTRMEVRDNFLDNTSLEKLLSLGDHRISF